MMGFELAITLKKGNAALWLLPSILISHYPHGHREGRMEEGSKNKQHHCAHPILHEGLVAHCRNKKRYEDNSKSHYSQVPTSVIGKAQYI